MEVDEGNSLFSPGSSHSPLRSGKSSDPRSRGDLLCKISFEINEEEEELLIYQNTTLEQVTEELIMKLTLVHLISREQDMQIREEDRLALQEQIKAKVEFVLESCPEGSAKTAKWKKKLRKFINFDKTTPIQSLVQHQESTLKQHSISYFGYKAKKVERRRHCEEDKNIDIIQRAKEIEGSLQKKPKKYNHTQNKNRLYEESKKSNAIKDYLWKLREQFLETEELSECTFQPNMIRPHLKTDYANSERHQHQDVFGRLYKEALEKQQKMKMIERQLQEKESEEVKKLRFVPTIDECSRQIAALKKEASKAQTTSIYDELYQKVFRKDTTRRKGNTWKFHPTICPKSQQIIRKARANQSYKQLSLHEHFRESEEKGEIKKETSKCLKKNKPKQKGHYLSNYNFLSKDSELSPYSSKRKVLGELKSNDMTSKSYRVKNRERTDEKSITRREKTCESECLFNQDNSSLKQLKSYKNIIDLSSFGSECLEEGGRRFKKTKQNLYFLHGNMEKSNNNKINISQPHPSSKQKNGENYDPALKIKKPKLNPYDFFKLEELKKSGQTFKDGSLNDGSLSQSEEVPFTDRKNQVFEEIFKLLNKSQSEQINAETIFNSNAIPETLRSVFNPMAEQMLQLQVGLDRQEFVWSLSRIFERLTPDQKGSFARWGSILALSDV